MKCRKILKYTFYVFVILFVESNFLSSLRRQTELEKGKKKLN